MESIRIKAEGVVQKHCAPADKVVPCGVQANNSGATCTCILELNKHKLMFSLNSHVYVYIYRYVFIHGSVDTHLFACSVS